MTDNPVFVDEFEQNTVQSPTKKQMISPDSENTYQRLAPMGMASKRSGTTGIVTWGGFAEDDEVNAKLSRFVKYRTYYNEINRTPVLGACVQTFLENVGSSRFDLMQSKHDTDGKVLEFFQELFWCNCRTPFRKIIQHLAMAKLYGFSMMTWNWRLRDDGMLTLDQLRNLPQHTIYRYLPDHTEIPTHIIQWDRGGYHPTTTGQFSEIPYWKIVHIVEDQVRNTREGDGLLRRVVEECFNYHTLKDIQQFGFKRSLRGILKFRAPREQLANDIRARLLATGEYQGKDKELSEAVQTELDSTVLKYEVELAKGVAKNNLDNHIRMDSAVIVHMDDKGGDRPVATPLYDAEFMDTMSDPQAHDLIKQEIDATEFRIASVFGLEATQLGKGGSSGTYNLSVDKTDNFRIRLESTLDMIANGLYQGIIVPFGLANGIDEMKLPRFNTEIIRPKDAERSMKILCEFEKAGFNKADPAYAKIRADEGLPELSKEQKDHYMKLQDAKFKAELEMPDAQLMEAKSKAEPNSKERGEPPNQNRPYQTRDGNKR